MTYQQLLSAALVKMGEGDFPGAELEMQAALAEAGRLDPEGPRQAEVYSYLAQLKLAAGDQAGYEEAKAKAEAIFRRFHEPEGA